MFEPDSHAADGALARLFATVLGGVLVASVAAGCTSDRVLEPNGGTGGATLGTGGVAGLGGMTGSGGGATGAGGAVAGTGGTIAGIGGMIAGTGGMIAGTGGMIADPAASEKALCHTPMFMTDTTTTPFTPSQFCTLYFSLCNDVVGATRFANETACQTAYNGYNMTPDADLSPSGQQGCRSYHLCNAYNGGNPTATTLAVHCPHATGFLPNDAGPGGPCP